MLNSELTRVRALYFEIRHLYGDFVEISFNNPTCVGVLDWLQDCLIVAHFPAVSVNVGPLASFCLQEVNR